MTRSEQSILHEHLVGLSALDETICWRNNTGQAWQGNQHHAAIGQFVKVEPGMVILREARPVKFGVKGSADIIGSTRGIPLAVETKKQGGRQSEDQQRFQRQWERAGGTYILSMSLDDTLTRISAEIRRVNQP